MKRQQNGFTLLEALIVLAIFGIVLLGTSQMVVTMLGAQQQQSKIAETNIEGIVGLDLLRQDLGKAGYGLPWNNLNNYVEATSNPYSLNDAGPIAPKGITSKDNVTVAAPAIIGTDYLVIRAANVAMNEACNKWAFVGTDGLANAWLPTSENLAANNDWVIILTPGAVSTESTARALVTSGGAFSAKFNSATQTNLASTMTTTGVIYGIDSNSALAALRRPFNRADYYVAQPAGGLPQRCAAGTGILYKAVLDQADDNMGVAMPLLDCVADMQVVFRWDQLGNGSLAPLNDLSALSAQNIHDQVKEVRVYVLAHEGQKDASYTYAVPPSACASNQIYVGGDSTIGVSSGHCFNVTGITSWKNYRWKIYSLVVKLENLL